MVCYLILMTMILNLLPDKKYEKYLRLFTGTVFLLLVFSPYTDLTGLEAQIAGAFERLTFQNDAKLLKREIEDADGKRMERLAEEYEDAVKTDLKTMAEGISLECLDVEVFWDTDLEGGTFGKIRRVEMSVGLVKAKEEAVLVSGGTREHGGSGEDGETGRAGENGGTGEAGAETERRLRREANREISDLKKRIGEYYGLEDGNIEINLEDE